MTLGTEVNRCKEMFSTQIPMMKNSSNCSMPSAQCQNVWQQISQSLSDKANQRKEENLTSKMSELSLAIKELQRCGDALIGISGTLADLFSGSGESGTNDDAVPITPEAKPIPLEEVRAVLADKSRAGFTADVRSLLKKYGADKLSEIDPAHYTALLADVEVLGNG